MKQLLYILLCISFFAQAQQYTSVLEQPEDKRIKVELLDDGKQLQISSDAFIYDLYVESETDKIRYPFSNWENTANIYHLPLSKIPSGIYEVRVNLEGKIKTFRIVRHLPIYEQQYNLDTIKGYFVIASVKGKTGSRTSCYMTKKQVHKAIRKHKTDLVSKNGRNNTLEVFAVYHRDYFQLNKSHSYKVYPLHLGIVNKISKPKRLE